MNIEPLESRIAPASVLNYTDIDGDKVTITSTAGDLTVRSNLAGRDITGRLGRGLDRLIAGRAG